MDPSVLFDKRALSTIPAIMRETDLHLFASQQFSPEAIEGLDSQEREAMQRLYGAWLPSDRRASVAEIVDVIRSTEISLTSWEQERQAQPFIDFDSAQLENRYSTGWRGRVDIDELWFLATHSTLLSRLRSRERDLAHLLGRLIRRGLTAAHVTLQGVNPGRDDQQRVLARTGKWIIWMFTGAAILGIVSPVLPWTAQGVYLLSFEL